MSLLQQRWTTPSNEEALCNLHCNGCDDFRFPYKRSRTSEENFSDVLALTAKELNSMSVQEREKTMEEVNGISSTIEEDPSFVNKCLSSLDEEIARVNVDKSAYELAMTMRPELQYDRKFRLMFLRADCFDVRKAARKMIAHFDTKRLFFGEKKLAKQITFDDLSDDDKSQIVNGYMKVLPSKDQTGRAVFFVTVKRVSNLSSESKFRGTWYQAMKLLEADEEVQRKGIVAIAYYVGCHSVSEAYVKSVREFRLLTDSVPLRLAGVHLCYDRPELRPYILLTQHAIGMKYRIRFRAHYGSDIECQYKLMTFGIPQSILPIDSSGELIGIPVKTSNDSRCRGGGFDKEDCSKEMKTPSLKESYATTTLRSSDVLLGKGVNQSHPANARLSNIIVSKRNEYEAGSKFEKTCIAMSIAEMVKESNGRFMKRREKGSDEWIEVGDVEARKSIIARFRSKAPN